MSDASDYADTTPVQTNLKANIILSGSLSDIVGVTTIMFACSIIDFFTILYLSFFTRLSGIKKTFKLNL